MAQTVTADGNLVCLSAACDINVIPGRWPEKPDCLPVAGRLTVFDGAEIGQRTDFLLEYRFPLFDRLPDGCWALSDTRCAADEFRSVLLGPDGAVLDRFCLGDGIAHLQCDCDGNVWCGYFDEGVYGNNGWGLLRGPEPIGSAGLVKFDRTGRVLWRYDDPPPFNFTIDDCYTLNVTRSVWTCFYSDFPIMQVSADHSTRLWINESKAAGPWAIAVDGNHVLLAGGYDGGARLVLHHLRDDCAEQVGEARMELSPGVSPKDVRLIGRGNQVHVMHDGSWGCISVNDMLQLSGQS